MDDEEYEEIQGELAEFNRDILLIHGSLHRLFHWMDLNVEEAFESKADVLDFIARVRSRLQRIAFAMPQKPPLRDVPVIQPWHDVLPGPYSTEKD